MRAKGLEGHQVAMIGTVEPRYTAIQQLVPPITYPMLPYVQSFHMFNAPVYNIIVKAQQ